jgi:hypothetical protein
MNRGISAIATICLVTALQLGAGEPLLLHEVKSLYVEPMPNGFDQSLIQKLLKWDAIRVVYVPEEADAVLKGGVSVRVVGAGGLTLTKTHAEVTLVDRKTGRPIWSAKKGSNKGSLKVAQKLVNKLRKDWEESAKNQREKGKDGS